MAGSRRPRGPLSLELWETALAFIPECKLESSLWVEKASGECLPLEGPGPSELGGGWPTGARISPPPAHLRETNVLGSCPRNLVACSLWNWVYLFI